MPNHGPVGGSGEPSISNQRYIVAQPLTYQCTGDRQHFTHSGATLGTFVANHHDIAGLYLLLLDRLESGLFLVKHTGRPLVDLLLMTSNFDYRAIWGQVTVKNCQAASWTAGRFHRIYHFLIFYGLVFPAYVGLCMIPTWRPVSGRVKVGIWAVAVLTGAPAAYGGFVAGKSEWIIASMIILVAARVVAELMPASADNR